MSGKELIKLMRKEGWALDRIRGSHYIMIKEGCRPISVPVHGKKDLAPGILGALLKQTRIKR